MSLCTIAQQDAMAINFCVFLFFWAYMCCARWWVCSEAVFLVQWSFRHMNSNHNWDFVGRVIDMHTISSYLEGSADFLITFAILTLILKESQRLRVLLVFLVWASLPRRMTACG